MPALCVTSLHVEYHVTSFSAFTMYVFTIIETLHRRRRHHHHHPPYPYICYHHIKLSLTRIKHTKTSYAYASPSYCTFADLDVSDQSAVIEFCLSNKVHLVVVGPEQPLADGIVDSLTRHGVKCFGPTKQAAELEVLLLRITEAFETFRADA